MKRIELIEWAAKNQPSGSMIWKNAWAAQVKCFHDLATMMGMEAYVVSTHTSKSIELPVVEIWGLHGRFIIRDNFHDVNLAVIWDFPIDVPMSVIYSSMSWEQYCTAMRKKEKYDHWDQWTSEELNDPRILRVEVSRVDGSTYWREVRWEEKERWLKRLSDPEWYRRDWSSAKLLVEGGLSNMGPGCTFYVATHPFAEGMASVLKYNQQELYEVGKKAFLANVRTFYQLVTVMQAVNAAGVYQEN